MIEVIEVLPGQRAIVSTVGLHRIVDRGTGETIDELVDDDAAGLAVGMFANELKEPVDAIPYDALCQRASS